MSLINTKINIISNSFEKEIIFWDLLFENKKTLLFFYPKDNTPWCTNENIWFTELKKDFENLWIKLVWVSKDSVSSHKNFIEKHSLENSLISDPDLILHKHFWAYWEKNNYWKIVLWVIRSTFLLDEKGDIIKEWKNVRAKWHPERVLKEIQ